jgi:hypothetical protein
MGCRRCSSEARTHVHVMFLHVMSCHVMLCYVMLAHCSSEARTRDARMLEQVRACSAPQFNGMNGT